MKNFFIACAIILLILIGCNKETISFNRYLEEISEIIYNDIQLAGDDFKTISDLLYKIKFTNKTPNNLGKPISKIYLITIEGSKYEFNIFKNNIIEYKVGGEKYYTTNNNPDLINVYDELKNKYTDLSFININPVNDDLDINYLISLLDNKKEIDDEKIEIYKFITNEPIYELKIINNNKTIYEKNKLEPNDYIYFKFLYRDNFKITFNNKYNYLIEIIPDYNNNAVTFNKDIKPTL